MSSLSSLSSTSPPSSTLRPLVLPVGAALLCTALLALWIRTSPLPMPQSVQVALSVGLVVLVAVVLAIVRHAEGGVGDAEPR
jgi:hypothetical protein